MSRGQQRLRGVEGGGEFTAFLVVCSTKRKRRFSVAARFIDGSILKGFNCPFLRKKINYHICTATEESPRGKWETNELWEKLPVQSSEWKAIY